MISRYILVKAEINQDFIISGNKNIAIKLLGEKCNNQDLCIQKYSICSHQICICPENYVTINNTCKELRLVESGYQANLLLLLISGTVVCISGVIIFTITIIKRKFYKQDSAVDVEVSFYCKSLSLEAQI